jgi:hypothetical protein
VIELTAPSFCARESAYNARATPSSKPLFGETFGPSGIGWLRRFFAFATAKHHVASELLAHLDRSSPVFGESRARVLAAARPLLVAAQHSHEVRYDLTLEQILDMIVAIATIHGTPSYLEPILQAALDGIRLPIDVEPT